MPAGDQERITEEIRRLLRRFAPLLREQRNAEEAPANWTYGGAVLRWHVVLETVIEPDIDIEFLPGLLIVRARSQQDDRPVLHALLPVPSGFAADERRIRCEEGYLEVSLYRTRKRDRRP